MTDYWGECFPMGGIGGAPFVGKTGFMAFSHHVPQDGHVVILFGPHIAISEAGELGKYLRIGQCNHLTACGAVLSAFDAAKKGAVGEHDPNDMQQSWLKAKVSQQLDAITAAADPIAALTLTACAYVCGRGGSGRWRRRRRAPCMHPPASAPLSPTLAAHGTQTRASKRSC